MPDNHLRLTVESLDAVPAELREHYAPAESGGFRLRLDDETDIDRVLKALRAERDVRRTHERRAEDEQTRAADLAAERDRIAAERDDARRRLDAMQARQLAGRIREACRVAGLHPAAVADAERAAREHFRVDDQGEAVPLRDDGVPLARWLERMREEAPHWFPATGSGGGASPVSSSSPSSPTMPRRQFEQLPPKQKRAVLLGGMKLTD
jgi:hypothetical protein